MLAESHSAAASPDATHPAPQRSTGIASASVETSAKGTKLKTLFQQGCAKIRIPKIHDPARLEAVMINTAGGMTGGDSLDWRFKAAEGSHLTVTSQACERIYRSSGGTAQIRISLEAENASTLNWLPQETILFDQGSACRRIDVDMRGDARLLLVEPLILGRLAMGESVVNGTFRDQWRIRHQGKLVHAEAAGFNGSLDRLMQEKAVLAGKAAMASVLLVAPGSDGDLETKLGMAREIIGEDGGISLWRTGTTGKLLARLVAGDGYQLRKKLIPVIKLLNDNAALPKSWAAQE